MLTKYKVIKKVRKSGTSLAINIPAEVVEAMGLKKEDLVEAEIKKL